MRLCGCGRPLWSPYQSTRACVACRRPPTHAVCIGRPTSELAEAEAGVPGHVGIDGQRHVALERRLAHALLLLPSIEVQREGYQWE